MSESNRPSQIPAPLWNRMPESARTVFGAMQGENGVANLLMQPTFGDDGEGNPQHSQAELLADMFNIMRMDVKRLGDAAGVDITVQKMSPEYAAELVQGIVSGDSLELLEKFNQLEDKRERIIAELAGEDAVEEHRTVKLDLMYTASNDDE